MNRAAALAALLSLAAAGCGGSESVSYDVDDGSGEKAHVEAGVKGAVALPPTFPGDVPVPKDSSVAMSIGKGKDLMVTFSAKGTTADHAAFYEERLKKEGWTLEDTVTVNGVSSAISGKKGGRTCSVIISGDEGEVMVQVNLSGE